MHVDMYQSACIQTCMYLSMCSQIPLYSYHSLTTTTSIPVAQNQWIRENLFDAHGNYLYCVTCIVDNLGVYTERLARHRQIKSVVWVFNRAQEEVGEGTCSGFAARQWLHKFRPKVALHPHKTDYCDTSKFNKEYISCQ